MGQPSVLCETKSTYKDIHSDQFGRNDKELVTVVNVNVNAGNLNVFVLNQMVVFLCLHTR